MSNRKWELRELPDGTFYWMPSYATLNALNIKDIEKRRMSNKMEKIKEKRSPSRFRSRVRSSSPTSSSLRYGLRPRKRSRPFRGINDRNKSARFSNHYDKDDGDDEKVRSALVYRANRNGILHPPVSVPMSPNNQIVYYSRAPQQSDSSQPSASSQQSDSSQQSESPNKYVTGWVQQIRRDHTRPWVQVGLFPNRRDSKVTYFPSPPS